MTAGRQQRGSITCLQQSAHKAVSRSPYELNEVVQESETHFAHRCLQVSAVLVYENDNAVAAADTPFVEGRDHWWQSEISAQSPTCPVEWVESEHPLFLLYTSGSTGEHWAVMTWRMSSFYG